MKIIVNILATVVLILGITFTILPMDTLAFLPIGITLLLAAISYFAVSPKKQKWEKFISIISLILVLIVTFKALFIKDEVAVDKEFQQKQTEAEKQDIQDLEELEDL